MTESLLDVGQPLVVLAVDDEPGVVALVRRCLDDERFTLLIATGGQEAIGHVATGVFLDLLITDLRMPEMDGDELARRARALRPKLKVLYLTSHADRLFGQGTGLREGEAYLDKPFTRAALREAVALLVFGSTTLVSPPTRPPDNERIRHDFKNQLAVIRGFAEILLADTPSADPRRGDFEEIHTAAVRALDLLERLYPANHVVGP